MKKILCLLLAALLTVTMLVSCAANVDKNGPDSDPDGSNIDDKENGADDQTEGVEPVSLPDVIEDEKDSIIVMTVGKDPVSLAEYRYFYLGGHQIYSSQLGDDFDETDPAMLTEFQNFAMDQIKFIRVVNKMAEENQLALTPEDVNQINRNIMNIYTSYGDEFPEKLSAANMTDTVLRNMELTDFLYQKLIQHMCTEGGKFWPTEDEIKKYAEDNDYIHVKHILIKTEGLDEAAAAEKETLAKEVLAKAQNGDDFDELIKTYSEDGMPEIGYYFTHGRMVDVFEDASYALEVGEISDLVQSDFGYHIIKKYELFDENFVQGMEDIFLQLAYQKMDDSIINEIENTAVEYTDEFANYNSLEKLK